MLEACACSCAAGEFRSGARCDRRCALDRRLHGDAQVRGCRSALICWTPSGSADELDGETGTEEKRRSAVKRRARAAVDVRRSPARVRRGVDAYRRGAVEKAASGWSAAEIATRSRTAFRAEAAQRTLAPPLAEAKVEVAAEPQRRRAGRAVGATLDAQSQPYAQAQLVRTERSRSGSGGRGNRSVERAPAARSWSVLLLHAVLVGVVLLAGIVTVTAGASRSSDRLRRSATAKCAGRRSWRSSSFTPSTLQRYRAGRAASLDDLLEDRHRRDRAGSSTPRWRPPRTTFACL